jgi:hypothetical protein
MANRLLLQSIVKFRDQIKDGSAKVFDIVQDYFNKTGKTVTEEERALILNEFAKDAPSNVQPLKSRVFDEIDETAEGFDPDYMRGTEETDVTAGELRGRINYPLMEKQLGVKLRGNETFDELLEIEKNTKEEGIGSLFPKDIDGFDDRGEVAEFVKKMRGAGISNKDIKGVFKKSGTDLAQGKKAATTLARAADMNADTAIKQEALADLDDDIANYGPNWWKGLGYNDGPMGYESYGEMSRAMIGRINNGIVDDLEKAGVDEEKVNFIFRNLSDVRDRLQNDPKAFVQKVADELEFEDIDYDLTFWNKYVDEIMSRIQKPEPRFEYGGMV